MIQLKILVMESGSRSKMLRQKLWRNGFLWRSHLLLYKMKKTPHGNLFLQLRNPLESFRKFLMLIYVILILVIIKSLAPKGNPTPTVSIQPSFNKKASQPPLHQSNAAVSVAPDTSDDVADETFSHKEGESKSIYVKNLPSGVSSLEVMEEFKNFGRVKQDRVFVSNRQEIGVCYAFVEFEDVQSAQNAVKEGDGAEGVVLGDEVLAAI